MSIILTLLSSLWSKFYGYIIAIGTALAILAGAYLKGVSDQKSRQASQELKDRLQILKKGQAIDEQVRDMSGTELDRNISRWLRDK